MHFISNIYFNRCINIYTCGSNLLPSSVKRSIVIAFPKVPLYVCQTQKNCEINCASFVFHLHQLLSSASKASNSQNVLVELIAFLIFSDSSVKVMCFHPEKQFSSSASSLHRKWASLAKHRQCRLFYSRSSFCDWCKSVLCGENKKGGIFNNIFSVPRPLTEYVSNKIYSDFCCTIFNCMLVSVT